MPLSPVSTVVAADSNFCIQLQYQVVGFLGVFCVCVCVVLLAYIVERACPPFTFQWYVLSGKRIFTVSLSALDDEGANVCGM